MSSPTTVTRRYGGFRGVDFRGEEINLARSPDSLNVWKDYKETESIRTRPGMERIFETSQPVYGIFSYRGMFMLHIEEQLAEGKFPGARSLIDGLKPAKSNAFVYEEIFYFMDGEKYLQYDGEAIIEVEGYVPTTSIGRKPSGGGSIHEDVNMLTGKRINTFLADGTLDYYLDAQNIDMDFVPVVTVDGIELEADNDFTVDYTEGMISFREAPIVTGTDGRDNVSVLFSKTVDRYRSSIGKCTLLQLFDNRVFFSGNPDYPNVVWHCSLNDPTYVSDLDYYREGMDSANVKGLVAGNNALWVFREPSDANTTVFYHTPTTDYEYGKIYPSAHSSVTTGCIGKAINFNDDIVFFSERGMEGISGDVTTEQVVEHRSTLVDRKLTDEKNYKDMILTEWEGYLLVFIGNKVYLADSRMAFTNEDHIEYEWYYWELEKEVNCACVHDGTLYLGSDDGVYTLSDLNSNVESYWTTPKDKFQYPNMQKTTNKRGCVVEATGDIALYAKLEDTDFELVGQYNGVTDHFISRIKRKKFKDIQLKFHSPTRFSLETATIECFIGGYIKR